MAVRNGEPFVGLAARSVLAQTYRDLELVVTDDGSTDRTPESLAELRDERVRVIRLDVAVGAAEARNVALRQATGEIVAIQDADDIACADRVWRQVEAFDRRPKLGLLGTWVHLVDAAGAPTRRDWPTVTGEALVAWNLLLFANPMFHSSCAYRRSLLDAVGPYDGAFVPSEDRDLWSRMVLVAGVDVLPDRLVTIRLHAASISARQHAVQRERSLAIRRRLLTAWTGDAYVSAAVDAWYDPRVSRESVQRLKQMFDRVVQRMEAMPERWTASELAAVRADRDARLDGLSQRVASRNPFRRMRRALASRLRGER